jgi:ABC-2 type transport system permease protein
LRARAVAGIVLRQVYLIRGSPVRIVPTFAWALVDIVLWGFLARYLNAVAPGGAGRGVDFVAQLLGAVLFWDFFARVMLGVTTAFLEDVWSRNFLNLFATPLRIPEYVCGLVITAVGTSTVGLAAMLALATAVFGLPFLALGAALVPILGLLFLFGIALGIVASAAVLRWGPASEWLVWPIPALLAPFAGVFYPVATLPGWMQAVARLLPPSYVFEALRGFVAGTPVRAAPLLGAAALALAQVAGAAWGFSRVFRRVVRSGLLARYSAENPGG